MDAALHLLTTAARTSYPWPLCWGNALWAVLQYRRDVAKRPAVEVPGWQFAILVSFALYCMPGNLVVNPLLLGRTPTCLSSTLIIPVHLVCWALVGLCPGDALGRLLNAPALFAVIDSLGTLDNATTAFGYAETGYTVGGPVLALACALCVNLAGGTLRHFAARGWTNGAATFDAALGGALLYFLALGVLYVGTLHLHCGGDLQCLSGTRLFEVLPWVTVARGLRGYLGALTVTLPHYGARKDVARGAGVGVDDGAGVPGTAHHAASESPLGQGGVTSGVRPVVALDASANASKPEKWE